MNQLAIAVRAVQGGWAVSSHLIDGPMMFLSGARAERHARRLGVAAAAAGRDVEIAVHDRQDTLVAAIRLSARAPAASAQVTTAL